MKGKPLIAPHNTLFKALPGLVKFLQDPITSLDQFKNKYGDIAQISYFEPKQIMINHPEFVKHILQENHRNYAKSSKYKELKHFLGEGLLTSEGDFWLKQRRIAQPAFHKQKLALLYETMKDVTAEAIDSWKDSLSSQDWMDFSEEMTQTTLKIAGRTLLSKDLGNASSFVGDAINRGNQIINHRIMRPFNVSMSIPLPVHVRFRKYMKKIDNLLLSIIDERKNLQEKPNDLLSMLIEATYDDGERMSEKQLRDEAVTMFIAGYETTAVSMTWTCYLLAQHPEIQNKVVEELGFLQGSMPEYEDLKKLPYLMQVIEESMRFYPPAWIMGRRSLSDDVIGGYHIPANANIFVCSYLLHRHEEFWENPFQFDPEHFSKEKVQNRHKFAYIPFGSGPRLCIGYQFALMEMQLLLSYMLQKYELIAIPNADVIPQPWVTLKPKPNVVLRVKERNKN